MGGQDPGQEWNDAYRYQLSAMVYAAGVAHFHRLPALRSAFKCLIEQLIHKMLRRDVWSYWYLTSQSGKFVDPDIVEMRKPWADPNKEENIMYSGHLLLMVSLHAMLFDDDKYDQPEALTFHWDPIFWGFGPEKFTYTRSSLQEAILAEMERHEWKGVCCEPNSIFIVCNQFPIIAMRYNDVRIGTNVVEKVLKNYTAAWEKHGGFLQGNKFVHSWYMVKQERIVPGNIGTTAWTSAFMNSWNPQLVRSTFPAQSLGFFTKMSDGRVSLNSTTVAMIIRKLVKTENADPEAWSTKQKAQELAKQTKAVPPPPFPVPVFGYIAQWVSEVGDPSLTEGLLRHADTFLNPTWDKGGLFYPRNETQSDEHGNWTLVEPYTGNAAIAYARLNVPDGQKKMWEKPWPTEHFSIFPYIDGITFTSGVDFLRCTWDPEKEAFVVTMRTWDGSRKVARFLVKNLPIGRYGAYRDEKLVEEQNVDGDSETLKAVVDVGPEETDLVILKSRVAGPRVLQKSPWRSLM
ncbi:hypothetical protein CKM354_000914200 [Cercospora kikuchii]|uniref:Linalool dehydratase/isomerase domain-containing protein n=1 Tax=Cercospora kikuchii TaxID=84275 RepID=A0A9P3CK92_9PEZI|nr:uncharacterized protein CKM354_000914200 [Cercospora kikuchii]GIZ45999.1 hypothetical protein CKM354_000914200 [Cercospora kikuchii]